MKRTLLLTGFPPDSRTGGAVIVRSLARRFAAGSLDWVTFHPPDSELAPPYREQYAGALPPPPAWGNERLRLARFWWYWKDFVTDPRAVARLATLIREKRYEVVWMVLDSPRARIAAELVRRLPSVRFHFSVHDHPIHAAAGEGMPPPLIEKVRTHMEFLGNSQSSLDAVTEELLADLRWTTPYQCVVTASVDQAASQLRLDGPAARGDLRVTCVGNYIGLAAVDNVVAGLKLWSAQAGRGWRLDVYGRTDPALGQPNVFVHPYREIATVRDELSKTDLFLLPLGFDANHAGQMRTSLPTKLVTYIEFGRLVMACVPPGSATERIVRDHWLGPVVTDLDPRSVVRAIDEAMRWDVEAANRGRDELISGRFCAAAIFARFMRTIDRQQ